MKKVHGVIVTALAFALAACSSLGVNQAPSPAQVVYSAKATEITLVKLATQYTSLPRCHAAAPAPRLCSDPATVDTVVAQLQAVDAVVLASERTVRDPRFAGGSAAQAAAIAATNAVEALQAIVNELGATKP